MQTTPPQAAARSASGSPDAALRQALSAASNHSGGWGYYTGNASRIEPTCWALLAREGDGSVHAGFLASCQGTNGWLVENPQWPVNIAFNALAAFTFVARPDLANAGVRQRVLAALLTSKGIQAPPAEGQNQDNSLQGWSWIDATFSWVEPTCWGLLALKKARQAGLAESAASARIAEAERLLVDRCCRAGGWNFGNANVMHQDLRPYVPTTALGLLAMQDRREEPAVVRSLAFLEAHWSDEISAPSLGLSALALAVHGRPAQAVLDRLGAHAPAAVAFGNWHGVAIAVTALAGFGQGNVFKI